MTLQDFLGHLEAARPLRQGRWRALCPAHDDHTPSLNVTEGDRGILVKCWAGCTIEEICRALRLSVRDLFYDTSPDLQARRDAQRRRAAHQAQQRREREAKGRRLDMLREAEHLISSAHDIDIPNWTPGQLDAVLNRLATAYNLLEREELYG